jgi:hypothetical protein
MFNALGMSLDQISPSEGSLDFRSSKPTSLLQGEGPVRLLEVRKDGYRFILDRRNQGELVFMRGRPHAPTRIARYTVADPASVKQLFVAMTWSPAQDVLYVGDGRSRGPATAIAIEAENITFRVAPDGAEIHADGSG